MGNTMSLSERATVLEEIRAYPRRKEPMKIRRRTTKAASPRRTARSTKNVLTLCADGIAGPCVGVIALAEALAAMGEAEMAGSLSSTILSLWKSLPQRQTRRLQALVDRTRRPNRTSSGSSHADSEKLSRSVSNDRGES
jgi:hypothetical protein